MSLMSKAAVLDGPNGTFQVQEGPVPDPDRYGFVLQQELCGICGTDAHVYQGHFPGLKYPLVLGHECVGRVYALGSELKTDVTGRPLKEGDRVYLVPAITCGTCYYCTVVREEGLCPSSRGYGFRPLPDLPIEVQGGYAEYLWITPRASFLQLNASAEGASILEPLTVGLNQVSRVHFQPGDTAVVQGAGAIGLLTMVAARESGASRVIVVGAPTSRLALAREFGADETINIEEITDSRERSSRVRKMSTHGYGADVVFECTGVPAAISEGIAMLRRGGTYVVAGHFTNAGEIAMNPFTNFTRKQIRLLGVWGSTRADFVRGRSIVEAGKYPFERLVSHQLPLDRAIDGIRAMSGGYRLNGEEVRKIAIASGAATDRP